MAILLKKLYQAMASPKSTMLLKQRSSTWYITTTISMGIFTDSFLYAIVVPILPYALPPRTGIDPKQTQLWTTVMVASYGGALLLGSPIIGLIADKTKTRCWPYLFSLLMLLSAALGLCLGRNIIIFVFARVAHGFSASLVWTVGLAILSDSVESKNIGQAMGFAAFSSSNAILLGLLLGGIIYEQSGYYSIFYTCFPLMLIDLIMRLTLIEKKAVKQCLTTGEATFKQARVMADRRDVCEQPAASRKPHVKACVTLPSARLTCALFSTFVSAMLMASFEAVIPLYSKTAFGWSSSRIGALFAALVVPSFLSSLIGSLSDRLGARWIVCTGYTLFCPLLVGLCSVKADTIAGTFLFCILIAGLGTCYGMVNVPILSEYKNIVADRETILTNSGGNSAYAQAYGMYNMAYSTGMLVGPIANGFIVQQAGFEVMMSVMALVCAATAVIAAIWCGSQPSARQETQPRTESTEERAL